MKLKSKLLIAATVMAVLFSSSSEKPREVAEGGIGWIVKPDTVYSSNYDKTARINEGGIGW